MREDSKMKPQDAIVTPVGLIDVPVAAWVECLPHTLSDCVDELSYWHELYCLRSSQGNEDLSPPGYARKCFTFWSLGQIRPRTKEEAIAVFRYMADENADAMDRKETNDIQLNQVGCRA